jgi:ParB family chromosome partitioning protein
MDLPLEQVTPNPHQPRREFNETALAELANSLKTNGLIQPIVVRRVGEGYQLIAGERRWRAAKLAQLPSVPAIVRDVDSLTQAQMALVENIQREDLNPIDRALAYRALIDNLGLTQNELAGRLGEDRSSVANYLRLMDLVDPVRDMVRVGRLTLGHAKLLAGVPDGSKQVELAEKVVSQNLSVRNLEALLKAAPLPAPAARSAVPAPNSVYLQRLGETLGRQLGLRVEVVRSAGRQGTGKLVLHYGSLDQFDELLNRLGVTAE